MQVLVTVVHAVAGEVLDGYRHAFLLHTAGKGLAHADNGIRVVPIGAHIGDGIEVIHIAVHNRGKSPVAACHLPFSRRDLAQMIGMHIIPRGRHGHRIAKVCALGQHAVAASLQIGRQQQRHFALLLQIALGFLDFLAGQGAEHHAAGLQGIEHLLQGLFIRARRNRTKELADLFFYGHLG